MDEPERVVITIKQRTMSGHKTIEIKASTEEGVWSYLYMQPHEERTIARVMDAATMKARRMMLKHDLQFWKDTKASSPYAEEKSKK